MLEEHDLIALLRAYIGGDTLARKALLDALDEANDPRLDSVRAEGVDWDALSRGLTGNRNAHGWSRNDQPYLRWLIDCARYGSNTLPEIVRAVREARRGWLQELFPEVTLKVCALGDSASLRSLHGVPRCLWRHGLGADDKPRKTAQS
jgi:hypothetical protein